MSESIENKIPVITIDGPSGVGKGTVGRAIADKLNFKFLDSGAIYRVMALAVIQNKLDPDNESGLIDLAENLAVEFKSKIYLAHQDVTDLIRSEPVSIMASKVSKHPKVREALLARQKAFAVLPGLVADGRDMGTVVFKNALVKFFLTASSEIRAKRRVKQLQEQGVDANMRSVLEAIEARDARDKGRKTSPLKPADDAVIINTDDLTPSLVLEKMYKVIKAKLII